MKRINFYEYAKRAIKESINSLNDHEEVLNFYGNPDQCTIECYFSNEIQNGKLYLYADCCEEELLIGEVDSLREEFEMARRDAFEEYLEELTEREGLNICCSAVSNPNTPTEKKQIIENYNNSKSIYCSMVLRLMDTDEYSENYCKALGLVLSIFPEINRKDLEDELDKYI